MSWKPCIMAKYFTYKSCKNSNFHCLQSWTPLNEEKKINKKKKKNTHKAPHATPLRDVKTLSLNIYNGT